MVLPYERSRGRRSGGRRPDGTPPPEPQMAFKELGVLRVGSCKPGLCSDETACFPVSPNMHKCLCPHDLSPPTADNKCPIRLTVPHTPRPIHNIIPPTGGNNTTPRTNVSTTTDTIDRSRTIERETDMVTIAAPASIAVFFLLILFVCCWKRKSLNVFICKEKSTRKAEPQLHTAEPLLAERYITNPQYSSAYSATNQLKGPAPPLIMKEALRFIEEIGEGCFGKVFKGELRLEGNISTLVAVKMLKETASRSDEDDFKREVNIMSSFQHENILTLIGVARDGVNPCMVFEFMPFGDLADVLRKNSRAMRQPLPGLPPLDSKCLLYIALQISRGMKYLAAQRFVHRDLACRNCLVGDDLIVKIADFGLSRDVYTCDYYKMGTDKPMPIRWMSPESIVYARFTLESDVYSYGVVLWEIYSFGKQPYYGHTNDGARKLILQGIMLIPPEDCPAFICELMRACWRTDPKDRIDFHDVCSRLQHIYDDGSWDPQVSDPQADDDGPNENDSWIMAYDNREKWLSKSSLQLPLPPADSCQQFQADLDPEGYLMPAVTELREYLTTLPG